MSISTKIIAKKLNLFVILTGDYNLPNVLWGKNSDTTRAVVSSALSSQEIIDISRFLNLRQVNYISIQTINFLIYIHYILVESARDNLVTIDKYDPALFIKLFGLTV